MRIEIGLLLIVIFKDISTSPKLNFAHDNAVIAAVNLGNFQLRGTQECSFVRMISVVFPKGRFSIRRTGDPPLSAETKFGPMRISSSQINLFYRDMFEYIEWLYYQRHLVLYGPGTWQYDRTAYFLWRIFLTTPAWRLMRNFAMLPLRLLDFVNKSDESLKFESPITKF